MCRGIDLSEQHVRERVADGNRPDPPVSGNDSASRVGGFGAAKRIWAKTWRENLASARTLTRLGLEHVRTIANDPAFGGCRDTLVFEGPWAAFVRNVQELTSPGRD